MTATDGIRRTEPQDPGWPSVRFAHLFAIGLWLVSLALFHHPLQSIVSLAFHDERSTHILVVPVISACLIYLRRKRVFSASRYCLSLGVPLLLLPAMLWLGLRLQLSTLNDNDRLSVVVFLIVLVWIALFVFCYGVRAFRSAAFPLLLLILMIPLPAVVAVRIVSALQKGSADTSYYLFQLIGMPIIRDGFRFSLPGIDIEIAEQCSGIRSGLSLFITGLLASHIFLQSTWKKTCLVLCTIPIAIFKNAVRIVTISWLGVHVNPSFFHGELHRQGGLAFSLLAFTLLVILLRLLGNPVASSRASGGNRVD